MRVDRHLREADVLRRVFGRLGIRHPDRDRYPDGDRHSPTITRTGLG